MPDEARCLRQLGWRDTIPPPIHPLAAEPRRGDRRRRLVSAIADYIRTESASGVLLLVAAVAALAWANSPWAASYDDVWHSELTLGVGWFSITEDLGHWINDGLMAVFFFVVGLEIKREVVVGELRDPRAASLPVLAAIGGMVVPALLFLAIAGGGEANRGWGIPMATDIAFVLGVMALLQRLVPASLKLFLLTLAIVDDIGAIVVIAIFYSGGIDGAWLGLAILSLGLVVVVRKLGVPWPLAYVPLGLAVWVFTFQSGVHATIAGVALGLLTPATPVKGRRVLEELEHSFHPWTSFVIVPLFALANAGVHLGSGAGARALGSRTAWAVVAGLVLGKTVGISLFSAMALRLRVGRLPTGSAFSQVIGAGALGGIGFTVSLFVTGLAYETPALVDQAKIGILLGSAAAALLGTFVLMAQRRSLVQPTGAPARGGDERRPQP